MEDCIFCKIIKGEIPSHKVYEDDKVLAFLDVKPVNKGHVLVVPKEHTEDFMSMSEGQVEEVFQVAQKVAKRLDEVLKPDGINIYMNNREVAGQIIFHAHVHVIPREKGDGFRHQPKDYDYQEGEAEELAKKLLN